MIAVAGASGTLGSRVATRLLEKGYPVRALSRDPAGRLGPLRERGAEVAAWDLTDSASLSSALNKVDQVVGAAHGLFPPVRGNDVFQVDARGNRRLVDAAGKAGVKHVLFVSNTVPRDSRFGSAKQEAEDHLTASGLPFTVLRPTTFVEVHAVRLLAEPLRQGRAVRFLGPGRTPLNWISVEDVAQDVVRILEKGPVDGVRTIGGPDVLSRVAALERAESVMGVQAKRSHLPLLLLKGARRGFRLFHRPLSDFLEVVELEASRPEDPAWVPPHLDWRGTLGVEEVLRRWWARSEP